MPLEQIPTEKKGHIVFEQLRDLIAAGEWSPGEKIPSENEIATRLSVSRITVRSSLQRLASLGIVESRQGEGTFVCEYSGVHQLQHLSPLLMLTKPDYESLGEFRFIIECDAARLAAKRCSPEILKALTNNYKKYEKLTASGKDNIEVDVDFHVLIAKATQNPFIQEIFSILRDYLKLSIEKYQQNTGVEPGAYYHKMILDAIRDHDPEKAYNSMKEHLSINRID